MRVVHSNGSVTSEIDTRNVGSMASVRGFTDGCPEGFKRSDYNVGCHDGEECFWLGHYGEEANNESYCTEKCESTNGCNAFQYGENESASAKYRYACYTYSLRATGEYGMNDDTHLSYDGWTDCVHKGIYVDFNYDQMFSFLDKA